MFDCNRKSGYRFEKYGKTGHQRDYDWIVWFEDYTFEFNSRETYLEFRKWWKEQYLKLSQEIRDLRAEIKSESRLNRCVSDEQYRMIQLRHEANRMMCAIEAAKKESARQVEAARKAA